MDFAYDHIAERSYSNSTPSTQSRSTTPTPKPPSSGNPDSPSVPDTPRAHSDSAGSTHPQQRQTLQTELAETFTALSTSPWATKLGGWWSNARKQGETYYGQARKEAERQVDSVAASRVFEDVRKRVEDGVGRLEEGLDRVVNEERKEAEAQAQKEKHISNEDEGGMDKSVETTNAEKESTAEETETFIARFKAEAAKTLKEVQRAEDAADEALLRFGTNIRSFLRDAVSVSAPEPADGANASEVLFESKDAITGKRVIHTSRFDAQLHALHTNSERFTNDPDAGGWGEWNQKFDVEKRTDEIARDLAKHEELRAMMERLVPEKVEYKDFWARYYFMRHAVEVQEEKRREMLKGMFMSFRVIASTAYVSIASTATDEEVGWDEDSDEEENSSKAAAPHVKEPTRTVKDGAASTTEKVVDSDTVTLKPPRRSHDEKSVADSEASYDLVSGAASHAASSPKEKSKGADESDDDWE